MALPMIDCRSLIEFCRAYEQHRHMANSAGASDQRPNKVKKHNCSFNSFAYSFCDHSPFAAVDVILLFMVLGALGFLIIPYFKLIFREIWEVFPIFCEILGDVIRDAPVEYVVGLVAALVGVAASFVVWEILDMKSRKCRNPSCKGLRKAIEYDIQLESEECLKFLPPLPTSAYGMWPLDLGQDHKELEAELKRMAPLNGRTVLIFRAPCGCPAGRLEVWGPKKIRRIKK